MRKLTLTLSAAALALVGAGTLVAQSATERTGPDANRDGTLTRAEHTAHSAARFARMDANGDGVINAGRFERDALNLRGGFDGSLQ